MEYEISGKKESRNYCHDFVKRLNEAKKKGFKLTGPITEKELRNFESGKTERPVIAEQRSIKKLELTPDERKRISEKRTEEHERNLRLDKLRDELKAEDKLRSVASKLNICIVEKKPEEKTTIYLK